MDVVAEIADLKRRMDTLEAAVRSIGAILGSSHQRSVEIDVSGLRSDLAAIRSDIADMWADIKQDLIALHDELAVFRHRAGEQLNALQAEMLRERDIIRCEMIELGFRIDRLLDKDGV
ncbi:hypothetical protein [Thermoactinospora rubra]|uniref:hypothetical protein n=1 Tax=Thermoactinospora rubra TaxID=1088767 RepID=UPI0011813883|nr:hypothetical protein [Thermoactinospora rubra]